MEKEKNKYYTPEIEEFHVGFEYEYEDINEGGSSTSWYKGILQPNEGYIIDQIYKEENIEYRVKYLDKEDIESLGFSNIPDSNAFDKGDFQINFQDYNFLEIYDECSRIIFQGSIKNKSELKKLLKQLKII